MSRIGRAPIALPDKVEVKINAQTVSVKGPKGQLEMDAHPNTTVKMEDGSVVIERLDEEKFSKSVHGLTRALIANMVTGVSEGFKRTLLIEGVGYQAAVQGKTLNLKLGFSHEINIEPPDDNTKFDVPKESRGRTIIIEGIDKQVVGQLAANIRELRPPEPYKGKGIRYEDERIIRKAGKAGKK